MEEFNGLKIPTIYEKYNLDVISFEDFITEIVNSKNNNTDENEIIITDNHIKLYDKINKYCCCDDFDKKTFYKMDRFLELYQLLKQLNDICLKQQSYSQEQITIYVENLHKMILEYNIENFNSDTYYNEKEDESIIVHKIKNKYLKQIKTILNSNPNIKLKMFL